MKRIVVIALSVVLALMVAVPLVAAQSTTTQQSPSTPGTVVPPTGDTYKTLSTKWWQWAYSVPYTDNEGNVINPLYDTTGANCSQGQNNKSDEGKPFFLAGSSVSNVVNRTECSVPAGRQLFFPIVNVECSTVEGNPPPGESLTECAKIFGDSFAQSTDMTASVDGTSIPILKDYRVGPVSFSFTLPKNNADFACPGSTFPTTPCPSGKTAAAGDGFYLLLNGLSKGTHTIEWGGTFPLPAEVGGGSFTQNVTYQLTVK